jgi:uncharacterized membrane protein YhaH (DUF805 family)
MELSEKQIARADDLLSEHGLVGLWGYVKVHLRQNPNQGNLKTLIQLMDYAIDASQRLERKVIPEALNVKLDDVVPVAPLVVTDERKAIPIPSLKVDVSDSNKKVEGEVMEGNYSISDHDVFKTLDGCIGRVDFLTGILLLSSVQMIVATVFNYVYVFQRGAQGYGVGDILGLCICAWPYLSLYAKRGHDRGRSGWYVFFLCLSVVGIPWLIVELFFLKGKESSKYRRRQT